MKFYVGLHQPNHAVHFDRAFISINRIRTRKSDFTVNDWIMDSGAFTEIHNHGTYRDPVSVYADHIKRWAHVGNLQAAVAQDWMCEAHMLKRTGLDIPTHQKLTIERYDELVAADTGVYVLPVLQGYEAQDYVRHLHDYGDRLTDNQWVGVGSVCKRQGNPAVIADVLRTIKQRRPDLKLHGFGVKKTALRHAEIRDLLHTADSMAWSFAARYEGRDANSWQEAKRYEHEILNI